MSLFFFLLRASRTTVILAVIAGIVSGLANVFLLPLIKRAMQSPSTDAWLVVKFLGLCLLLVICQLTSQTLLINLTRRAVAKLSMHLCQRILAVPLRHLEEIGAPRLLATLTTDVPAISQGLNGVPMLFTNLTIVVGVLVYLGILSLKALLAVLGFLAVGMAVQRFLMRSAMWHMRRARDEQDHILGHFRSLIEGIKELKLHFRRKGAFVSDVLQPTVDVQQKENTIGQMYFTGSASWGRLMFFLLIGFLLFVMPAISDIDHRTLAGYAFILFFMMGPLQSFGMVFQMLARARVSLRKVEDLGLTLEAGGSDSEPDEPAPPEPAWQALELAGVTHQYHNEREGRGFTLGPIDLVMKPGELTYLVGGNGSGKTTLAKVLTGLYFPETGEIRLDDKPVTGANRESFRQMFSVVFNDFYLFESLLGLGAAGIDRQAREYLALLQLDHQVTVQDGALSTTDLSKGQRKRLALLTAYLEDRPIYVFDEWAADQDPLFKKIFYTQLLPDLKARGKGLLVITHDERYFHLADRIIQLEDGKLFDGAATHGIAPTV
jgi:putative pyoverdin transport system ATP-binding/permease protein